MTLANIILKYYKYLKICIMTMYRNTENQTKKIISCQTNNTVIWFEYVVINIDLINY